MERDQALRKILKHRDELVQRGVLGLSLLGSVAREEADPSSDVDILVSLAEDVRGLAHFRRLDELEERLAEILGFPVDLVDEMGVSRRMAHEIQRDRVVAF